MTDPNLTSTSASASSASSVSSVSSSLFSQRQKRDCSSCLEMLNSTLMNKNTRVSKLLSAMNANVFSNAETGDIDIRIVQQQQQKSQPQPFHSTNYHTNRSSNLSNQKAAGNKSTTAADLNGLAIEAMSVHTHTNENDDAFLRTIHDVNEKEKNTDQEKNSSSSFESTPQSESSISPSPIKVQCTWCGSNGAEGGARAYVKGPEPLSIVLCANRLSSADEIQEVLVHELIHVYDVTFRGLDLRKCTDLAHSEIRAAREAECHDSPSLFRNLCIKNTATAATNNMFSKRGKECVNQMFDIAIKDRTPLTPRATSTRPNGSRVDRFSGDDGKKITGTKNWNTNLAGDNKDTRRQTHFPFFSSDR